MSSCTKCKTLNEDSATRCRACNAILPVRLEAPAGPRYERDGVQASLTGLRCKRCGAINPYTRFKCEQCGTSLTQYRPPTFLDRLWIYVGIGMLLMLIITLVLRAL